MQGELFNDPSRSTIDPSQANRAENWLNRFRITLRIDHLSVVAISALILYVLVFSFGVEKGKEMAFNEIKAEKAKKVKMAEELQSVQVGTEPLPQVASPAPLVPKESAYSGLTGKYTIQLITFTSRPRAEQEVKKLKGKGHRAFVLPSGKFFLVCVDAYEEMKDAREKLVELQSEGTAPDDAYVRPFKGSVNL